MTAIDFLTLTLFLTGVYAIYKSLQRLNKANPATAVSDSIIQTKWFKWWAPAGLVYGLLAFAVAFFMIQYDKTKEYDTTLGYWKGQVDVLKQENEVLKLSAHDSVFVTEVNRFEAKPLWGGRVLAVYKYGRYRDTKSSFVFNGAFGVSVSKAGTFAGNMIEFDVGDRIYMKSDSSSIWCVNVLSEKPVNSTTDKGGVTLQFLRY